MEHVRFDPSTVRRGSKINVYYKGLLANSGADSVWLHLGYDGWKSTATIPMFRQGDGSFACTVEANSNSEVNVCFKDSANNWDNNSGWNWKCSVI